MIGPRPSRWTGALLGVALGLASPVRAQEEIVVKGSDTIGEHLGQALARALMRRRPALRVRWESIGSSSAFVGLLDGSAALGASSRGIRAEESERAARLGLQLREYVIGYDGIAVIVHPSNPTRELTLQDLAGLFTDPAPTWGGAFERPTPVRRLSRPAYSGTHAFFKGAVLGPDRAFAASADMIEETDAITREVARDPRAISYVGLGFVEPEAVRVVPIRRDSRSPAVLPTERSIRDGSYPIFRPLFLYAREDAPRAVGELIALALSDEGRALVALHDFVPPDRTAGATEVATIASAEASTPSSARPPALVRVLFELGSVDLSPTAQRALEGVASKLESGRWRAELMGHCDSTGSPSLNRRLAVERAASVSRWLREAGAPADRIEIGGRSSDEPVATNLTVQGRRRNRRVDVLLLPAPEPSGPSAMRYPK